MKKSKNKLPLFDIYPTSWLEYNDIPSECVSSGSRVYFEFDATDQVYTLLKQYNENSLVPILDFVNVLRRVRSKMLSKRNERSR